MKGIVSILLAITMIAGSALGAPKTGQIGGNVPSVDYDAHRLYTLLVVPENYKSDAVSQAVIQEFGADPIIRENSITRINVADKDFQQRWGNSFVEAQNGVATVAVIEENGSQASRLYKMPMTAGTDFKSERLRCQQCIANVSSDGCIDCLRKKQQQQRQQKQAEPPAATPPAANAPPQLPPIANTPPAADKPAEEEKANGGLIAVVLLGMGGLVLVGMGGLRAQVS